MLGLIHHSLLVRHKLTMQKVSSRSVGGNGFISGDKRPQVDLPVFERDASLPSVSAKSHALHPRAIIRSDRAVATILALRCYAKVFNPVVGSISVDMIDKACWPLTIVKRPSHPMRHYCAVHKHASQIAGWLYSGCNFSSIRGPLSDTEFGAGPSRKGTCISAVLKMLPDQINGAFFFPSRIWLRHVNLRKISQRRGVSPFAVISNSGVAAGCWKR